MTDIKYKKWDSEFFGIRIGAIECDGSDSDISQVKTLLSSAMTQGYDLIYLFSDTPIDLYYENDKTSLFRLVDHKVLYYSELSQLQMPDDVEVCEGPAADLYDLEYRAGHKSRFHLDENFPDEEFRRLYRRWVDNAFAPMFAGTVLVTNPVGYTNHHSVV